MTFWVSVTVVLVFVLWGIISPNQLATTAADVLSFTTEKFGWFYLFATLGFLVFSLYLAFSKYGSIRLDTDDDNRIFRISPGFPCCLVQGWVSGLFSFRRIFTKFDSDELAIIPIYPRNVDCKLDLVLLGSNQVKAVWGILQSSIAAVLLLSGGLQGLQTASIVAAFPFAIILILMCVSILKALQEEERDRRKIAKERQKETRSIANKAPIAGALLQCIS